MNLENRLFELLVDHFDLSKELTSIAFLTIAVLVILLVVWLSNFLFKRFVLNFIRSLPEKRKTYGSELANTNIQNRLA